jgi:DnaJ-domain-containing protein 1
MFENLSNQDILIIFLALFFGFGIVRFALSRNESNENSPNMHSKSQSSSDETWSNNQNCYQILDIEPTATSEDIKSAYNRKISQYHPDKVSSLGPEFTPIAENKTKLINAAYKEALDKLNQ